MFESKQIFAFTGPTPEGNGDYVRILQAFTAADGIEFRMRDHDGRWVVVTLSLDHVNELKSALSPYGD